jgi:ribosomal protein L7/L12
MVVGALLGGSFALVAIGVGVLIWHLVFARRTAAEPAVNPPAVVRLPPEIGMTMRALLLRRQKIQAIKLVRDNHPGMSLKDAKDLVDGIQQELPTPIAPHGSAVRVNGAATGGRFANQATGDVASRARQLKQAGQEVEAVRLVRAETGMNLTEAMSFVQSLG